jgi:hypothetical protein
MTYTAATFVLNRATTVRACAAVVGMHQVVFFMINHVHLDCFCDCIGAGGDTVFTEAGRLVASDADHLFNGLSCLNA